MEAMNKEHLSEQDKKDIEALVQLPEGIRRNLLSFGAGMMVNFNSNHQAIDGSDEKKAG